ncbi:MAG: N-formylglutamate amidohydrolase [Desulfofustis sp.]
MAGKLPIIVYVPHGGEIIAPEMSDQMLLSRRDIFSDGDPLTREIYDFRGVAAHYFETSIARAVIDLNRAPHDLPPANVDGVVKSQTVTGKGIYRRNRIPSKDARRRLLKKYHTPYHEGLGKKSKKSGLFCGIDCHTMLNRAPVSSSEPGRRRPFICLSNRGDRRGNRVKGRHLTCPPEMIRSLADFLIHHFPEEADNIKLNEPFTGGYIIQRHSRHLPWIQIELNRKSYLSPEYYDPENLCVCHQRLVQLRNGLLAAISDFVRHNYRPHRIEEKVA